MPSQLCYLDHVAPEVQVDLMYAGHDNFVGRPIAGYTGKRAILRCDVAWALHRAAREFSQLGYKILLRDAYRPHRALADIAAWAKTDDQKMKARYYPRISKAQIHGDRYIGDISEHSYGIAVDITLLDTRTGKALDMGGPIDFLDPSSATAYSGPHISSAAQKNRAMLLSIMSKYGFKNYEKEWWHYWYKAAPAPWMRYDFALNDHMITP